MRAPCGAVGHGAHYHSQSVESFFSHVPGLKVTTYKESDRASGIYKHFSDVKNILSQFHIKLKFSSTSFESPPGFNYSGSG